jgi:tetratricopeptide (TPR) repeat protein
MIARVGLTRRIAVLCLLAAAVAVVAPGGTAPADAAPPWITIQSPHFTLVGDAGETSLHEIAARLEQFRTVLGRLLPNATISTPVPTVVVVFGSQRSYEPFRPRYQGKTVPVGGSFQSGPDVNYVTLAIDGGDAGFGVICHEYTHLVLANSISSVPAWLGEGLAEYYSTFSLAANGKTATIGRVIPHHVALLQQHFVPLTELLNVNRRSPLYNEVDKRSIFYAESWALVHYLLMESPDGEAAINRYLTAIASGEPSEGAFRSAFRTEPSDPEEHVRRYTGRSLYHSFQYTFRERVETAEHTRGRTLSAAETNAWLGDLLMHLNRLDEAGARLQEALRLDPDLGRAHLSLGLLFLRQQRGADAWPHLERAVAIDPASFQAQYSYALSLLRYRADDPAHPDLDAVNAAAGALRKAIALNPDSTDALAWLGYADLVAGAKLDEARAVVTRAMSLAPGRLDYRIRLAEICLRQNDLAEAVQLLTPLAAISADTGLAEHARSLLRSIVARAPKVRPRLLPDE